MTTCETTRAEGVDEFGEIERLFRPLTLGAPEARDLADDAAVLSPRPGSDLVLTTDTLVEGVHFLATDPPETVGRKLLRVNLSDLAAKGAEPIGWLLNIAWPRTTRIAVREAFTAGLAIDQHSWNLPLLGGDTVVTSGPWTLSATLLGYVPAGRAPSRSSASPGDVLMVSGSIGDGVLGLEAARSPEAFGTDAPSLLMRYRLPEPRLTLREVVRGYARAACDISDGLFADAGRIASASGCAVELALECLPLSDAGVRYVERSADRAASLAHLASGGDDYELALAVSPEHASAAGLAARRQGVALACVGRFTAGSGVTATYDSRAVAIARAGWTHR